MSAPSELSFDEILKFMLANNGKVTNHELVKHFKVFLMNPDMRNEARNTFKKHVNTLAIIKNQNNEKWLILKKKYFPNPDKEGRESFTTIPSDFTPSNVPEVRPRSSPPPYRPPPMLPLNQDFNVISSIIQDNQSVGLASTSQMTPSASNESFNTPIQSSECSLPSEDIPPKTHPRRKSSGDKNVMPKSISRTSLSNQDVFMEESQLSQSQSESMLLDNEQKISVKERKQMFNRMASESDGLKSQKLGLNTSGGADEEDRASLKNETDLFDTKQKQWILCAARGEYHALAKMCKENAKLIKTKDPFTYTAMHWACKRGDENLVKLLAGTARQVVNERSGYTPLHIAMQFRHENVYRLLVETYDADPNVRDWSGKKPRQYLVHMDMSLSPGSYRKKESFLRIGSLNVRVKKTTEAFSNFLGVGATRSSTYMPKRDRETDRRSDDSDQMHKSWGSADNIQKDDKLMPPPSGKVKRRSGNSRKGLAAHSQSTPSTPDQPRALMKSNEEGDSDSDSAAGFHAAWRQQRASCS